MKIHLLRKGVKTTITACLIGLFIPEAKGEPTSPSELLNKVSPQTITREYVTIEIGKQKTVHVSNAKQISIGKEGIVDVRVLDNDEVLVTGLQDGSTELLFWNLNHQRVSLNIEVIPPLSNLARDIRRVLSDVQNLEVAVVGSNIVLDGKLLTMTDAQRVDIIATQIGGKMVINLCSVDRGPENVLVEKFITDLFGLGTVDVRIIGGTAYLTGYVYNQQQKERLLSITKGQVNNVIDLTDIREVMIDTEILFVKLSHANGENMGINLLDNTLPEISIDGDKKLEDGEWSRTGIDISWTATMLPKLNYLVNNGDASILARPHIITKSGEKGSFQSGGALYYKVTGSTGGDLKSVDYGIIMSIEPHFRSENEIFSAVSLEISVPVPSGGTAELSLDKYEMENTVSCQLGQSVVMSGFMENISNSQKTQMPILGNIPLLNLFFRNKTGNNTETEVMAIITPRIMNAQEQNRIKESLSPSLKDQLANIESERVDAAGVPGDVTTEAGIPRRKHARTPHHLQSH